jgi:hypothetical protein
MSHKLIDTGGPAFPLPAFVHPNTHAVESAASYTGEGGMTLRQWYAGMALQGMLASGVQDAVSQECGDIPTRIAQHACRFADALIAAEKAPLPDVPPPPPPTPDEPLPTFDEEE